MAAGSHLRYSACVAIVLTLTCSSSAAAQERQMPVRPKAPPRDAPAEKSGTAVIRGRVVAADTGRPLRRARVTISAPGLRSDSHPPTSTDADGRYEFKDLPAARYKVAVARSGYLPLDFGQRRPGEPGRPIQVFEAQVLEKIDFALPRMSVITGHVTDEVGEAMEGVAVFAMRLLFYEGRRRLVPVGSIQETTDDAGEYRLSRLAPGTYFVMASTRETWNAKENGRDVVLGYLPTYFPGVVNATAARRVTLGVGRESPAVDIALVPGRAAKVSGTAVDSKGRPFTHVGLTEEVRGLHGASFRGGPSTSVAADGSFTISNVPPGEYTLGASRMAEEAGGEPEVASMPLVVEGSDIENITLVGSSGGTVSGRVASESGTLPKEVRINIFEALRNQPTPAMFGAFKNPGWGRMQEDGSFTVDHVMGRSVVKVHLPDGWMLKSVLHGGDDITDTPIELKSGEVYSGVEIVVTDRVTSVSGQLLDDKHAPITDATVLVFTTDATKWSEGSRLVSAARPDQKGEWEIKALPPGEYLAIALDYVEDTAWNDPEYLESLRQYAEKLTMAEGGQHTIALKMVTPKQ
jgi:hypothetical protein